MREPVEGVVALADGTDEAAEGVDDVLALDGTAVVVNLGDRDLDRSVVLGLDDAVGGTALAGDVEVDGLALVVLHGCGMCEYGFENEDWEGVVLVIG